MLITSTHHYFIIIFSFHSMLKKENDEKKISSILFLRALQYTTYSSVVQHLSSERCIRIVLMLKRNKREMKEKCGPLWERKWTTIQSLSYSILHLNDSAVSSFKNFHRFFVIEIKYRDVSWTCAYYYVNLWSNQLEITCDEKRTKKNCHDFFSFGFSFFNHKKELKVEQVFTEQCSNTLLMLESSYLVSYLLKKH